MNINKRDILKVLLSFIIFFYIGSIAVLICRGFLNIDFKNHPIYVLVLEAVVELIIGIIVFFLYKDLFKKSIKKIKESQLSLKKIGEVLLLGYVTVYASGLLYIRFLTKVLKAKGNLDFSEIDVKTIAKETVKEANIKDIIKEGKSSFKEAKKEGKFKNEE